MWHYGHIKYHVILKVTLTFGINCKVNEYSFFIVWFLLSQFCQFFNESLQTVVNKKGTSGCIGITSSICLNWHISVVYCRIELKWALAKSDWWSASILTWYTNGKKKRCIAKILITQNICSECAWQFINRMSLIQTFNYQTFTCFHVRLVRHLYFLWKLLFMSSAAEKQHATKLSDAKQKFMEVMMRKPLYFFQLVRIDDVTPYWKSASVAKCNIQESNCLCWRYLMFLDYLMLSVQNALLVVSLSLK